ncbi:MAG: TadE/TadG family type IV pilus assembly protein [Candidatus Limnocylindria bacterium]
MSDHAVSSSSKDSAKRSRRGQSLVEFALVLPMLLVLLLGVADFGRVFQAGIVVEASARNAAEAAAQEYLQLKRGLTTLGPDEYMRVHAVALETVCKEAERLPNRAGAMGSCTMPAAGVCIHDDEAEIPGYAGGGWCGTEQGASPSECSDIRSTWSPGKPVDGLPYVEVRLCYRFTTLFNLQDLQLPLANGLSIGDIWLQKDRAFTVADY